MSAPRKPWIVLDFDGVMVNSMDECRLVTWLGAHPPDPSAPVSSYLVTIDPGFAARFDRIRGYARMLEHFMVAHHTDAAQVRTRAEFAELFSSIPADQVAAFAETANAARSRFRSEEPYFWAGLHPLYPGVAQMLRDNPGAIAVATARDEKSVRAVLDYNGLGGTVTEITSECRSKAQAVLDLCARYEIEPREIVFIDDNIENVTAVAASGARTYWAMWGHHAPEDLALSRQTVADRLELDELPWLATPLSARSRFPRAPGSLPRQSAFPSTSSGRLRGRDTPRNTNTHHGKAIFDASSPARTDQPQGPRRQWPQDGVLRTRGGAPVPGLRRSRV